MSTAANLRNLHDALVTELIGTAPDRVPAWLTDRAPHIDVLEQGDPVLAREIRERAEQRRKG